MKITIIEPTWDGLAHCPVNLGVIRIVRTAYPEAKITFVAGERHTAEIRKIDRGTCDENVTLLSYLPQLDADTLPKNILITYKKIKKTPRHIFHDADLIIQTSCTASSLNCFNWMGLSNKTVTYLHGNANEIESWRSKNPIRKYLDFTSSLKRFVSKGGKVLVYETGIKERLSLKAPWIASQLHKLGHPLLEEEGVIPTNQRTLGSPIKIGFAGNATVSKGFPEFIKLADTMQQLKPDKYEFHAFSNLHSSCKNINQSSLTKPAHIGMPRDEFIAGLKSMDFIFAWHSEEYYSLAASGILYDAVNLGIPMIARKTAQIQHLEHVGMPVALHFETIDDVSRSLGGQQPSPHLYENLIHGLARARLTLTTQELARKFRGILAN